MKNADLTDGTEAAVEACVPLGMYPIRVVAAQTGLGVHTLRAWERRYGLPRPTRTAGEHRLYRHEDVVLLRRVQALIAGGTPPSRACAMVLAESGAGLRPAEPAGAAPTASALEQASSASTASMVPSQALVRRLLAACIALDEAQAGSAISEAFCLHGPDLALESVIIPVLVELGAAWAAGTVSVAAEHFATTMIRARLLAALDGCAHNEGRVAAVLGAGPGDQHELLPMALALLLRRRGWRAVFLGPDTPLEALRDAIVRTRPLLVCLSAAIPHSAERLIETLTALHALPECSSVLLAYGGAPFRDDPALRGMLEGVALYLGDTLLQAAARAHVLLQDGPASTTP